MRKCEINENIHFTSKDPRELFFTPGFVSLQGEENAYLYHRSV